jgi:hypothetical protein
VVFVVLHLEDVFKGGDNVYNTIEIYLNMSKYTYTYSAIYTVYYV